MSSNNPSRRRSRPVEKKSAVKKIKRNKPAMLLAIFMVFILIVGGLYAITQNLGSGNTTVNYQDDSKYKAALADTVYPVAVLETSKGAIAVELYTEEVPDTCNNFINLVKAGFYTNLVFHRVANIYSTYPDRYIIQGGGFDSDGNKKTSPYGEIDLEISDNVRHVDGAIAMARTQDLNSATSQFYICDGEHDFLDDNYAAFGKVIYGMDVVREIARVDTGSKNTPQGEMSNWPVNDILINKALIVKE